jgi:deoxyribonuclease-1
MKKFVLLLLSFAPMLFAAPADFNSAKKLAQRIYADEAQTFYCGCPLRWVGGKGQVDLAACGYQIRKNGPRANRIEWEHVMPAEQFGSGLTCWQQGGREQCGDRDQAFKRMEADLFNLKPAIGEVNGDRAHFRFSLLPEVAAQHGQCPIRIDFKRKLVEPRTSIRGDIARIYFYMADRYQIPLSMREQQLFLEWQQQDPVDQRELALHQRIAQQMGHANPFVTGDKEWFIGYQVAASSTKQALTHAIEDLSLSSTAENTAELKSSSQNMQIIGNKNSKKYHLSHCPGFSQVKVENQQVFKSEAHAKDAGYARAGNCK